MATLQRGLAGNVHLWGKGRAVSFLRAEEMMAWLLMLLMPIVTQRAAEGAVSRASGNASRMSGNVAVTVVVDGQQNIGETDDTYVCATLDWWPPEKCDYGTCSWGHASVLNLDLGNQLLQTAIREFSPLKIRIGGTLQDRVIYKVGAPAEPCKDFTKNQSSLFGFSGGCLPMQRWDELNSFFQTVGCEVAFGLNALYGRMDGGKGNWDPSNALDFIKYTQQKGYKITAWELGNELSGSGIGVSVPPGQYAKDMASLSKVARDIYNGSPPLLVAPDEFFDSQWTASFLRNLNQTTVNVITHHIYNLGPGVDSNLVSKILNPVYLSGIASTFRNVKNTLETCGSWTRAWVGEAGGAYNSGHHLVTDAFVMGFWYLDQLGMAAMFGTKTYCRQSLIGGNYGLLNTTTFSPNPDYYGALLWHRLMGPKVLLTSVVGSPYLRAYAHCTRGNEGATLLLLNLSNDTTVVTPSVIPSDKPQKAGGRKEYHLTAKGNDLHSQTVLLNGQPLEVQEANGRPQIPELTPRVVPNATSPIVLRRFSIAFISDPSQIPACP